MRTSVIREEIQRLLTRKPFKPFILNMENGDRVTLGHPENIAFDPPSADGQGSPDFYVLSKHLRYYGTFDAVTSVANLDSVVELES